MKINEVIKFIEFSYAILNEGKHIVPYLWGPPGIGKSAAVKEAAEKLGVELIDLRLSLLDGTDLRGLPRFDGGHCYWSRPEFIPEKGAGILFLDELNTALPAVQNAALQLVYDRRVGAHKLGDGWLIVCASNRKEHGASVWKLSSAMVSRVVHLNIEPVIDDFIEYGMKSGRVAEEIIAFLKFRPELLYQGVKKEDTPYPTPRAWEFLSHLKDFWEELEVVSGVIGEGAGQEFTAFRKVYQSLPDIDKVLQGDDFEMPEEPSAKVALLTAVATRADKKNIKNVLQVLHRFEDELNVYGVKLIFMGGKKDLVVGQKEWKDWVNRFKNVIL